MMLEQGFPSFNGEECYLFDAIVLFLNLRSVFQTQQLHSRQCHWHCVTLLPGNALYHTTVVSICSTNVFFFNFCHQQACTASVLFLHTNCIESPPILRKMFCAFCDAAQRRWCSTVFCQVWKIKPCFKTNVRGSLQELSNQTWSDVETQIFEKFEDKGSKKTIISAPTFRFENLKAWQS